MPGCEFKPKYGNEPGTTKDVHCARFVTESASKINAQHIYIRDGKREEVLDERVLRLSMSMIFSPWSVSAAREAVQSAKSMSV